MYYAILIIKIYHWCEGYKENPSRGSLTVDCAREVRIFLPTPHTHDRLFFLLTFRRPLQPVHIKHVNSRFLSYPGEDNLGRIRISIPGLNPGFPYLV